MGGRAARGCAEDTVAATTGDSVNSPAPRSDARLERKQEKRFACLSLKSFRYALLPMTNLCATTSGQQ